MPGVSACGRCGSPVALKTLDVDVLPPRASEWSKRRRRFPLSAVYYAARDANQRAQEWWFRDILQIESPDLPLGLIGRLIVPGWPQFYRRQWLLGNIFLVGWLACLFFAFLFYGLLLGSVLVGLAFSVHLSSCISALAGLGVDSRGFWINLVVAFAVLVVCIYLPVGWLGSRVASPNLIGADYFPFARGDVLLYSPANYWIRHPRPGDIVVYRQRPVNYNLPPPQHTAVRIAEGQRFDRILAVPGDTIVWKDGRLRVNGEPSAFEPLDPAAKVPRLSFYLPAGHYLIIPTAGPPLAENLDLRGWYEVSVVPVESIRGRIFLRSYPFTRFGRIR
jgi:signal peptidase I